MLHFIDNKYLHNNSVCGRDGEALHASRLDSHNGI